MRVAIHQPQYWPWPRYIHKALTADVFVYLDTVQFSKNGLQNRNMIKTAQGGSWLTIPVRQKLGQQIKDVQIADVTALRKHYRTLQANYARAAGFIRWQQELDDVLATDTDLVCDVAIRSTEFLLDRCGATSRRLRASELELGDLHGSQLVAAICKQLGATEYLSGAGALDYMNRSDFDCTVSIQEWQPFTYPQQHSSAGFVQDLSTLDLLLNAPDEASGILRAAGSWRQHWTLQPQLNA